MYKNKLKNYASVAALLHINLIIVVDVPSNNAKIKEIK